MRSSLPKIPRALPLIAGVLAALIAAPEPMTPSAWAAKNLFVADGPRAGSRFDPALAPYTGPIIDAFGPDGDANFGVVRKSAQTGLSEGAIALVASYIDRAPCRIGYAVQTTEALAEFNREKLAPSIALTPALRAKVRPQTSRSAHGSTEKTKRYAGGSLSLINGNAASDLKSRTLKVGVADEVDAWPDSLGDDGDPLELFKDRFISFHATGDWRLFVLSTPTLLGSSRIDALFKAGDQRLWHVAAPCCGKPLVFQFKNLKFNRKPPYCAYYVTQCCGVVIEHHEKTALVRAGRFIATNAEGTYPSWHVDALISQFEPWDHIAEAWWNAQGDETKLKRFYNSVLGLPFEVRGDAPDHIRLLERKGGYEQGKIPARGLLLTGAADVQHNGIWYEIVAYASNGESWTVQHGFLEGDTTDPERGAFASLTPVVETNWPDAFAGSRPVDAFAIDAGDGGRFNQVLSWARGRPRIYAIKGAPGWTRPAIGTPTRVDLTIGGRKLTRGATLWPVGTWSIKATLYANLRKLGIRSGAEIDPPGYCHFHDGCDERYFRQITSEYLGSADVRGRTVRVWKETGPNHLLDCRVYATAMAEMLGLTRMTAEQWAELARHRGLPPEASEIDLFSADPLKIEAKAADPARETSDSARVVAENSDAAQAPAWRDRSSGWWNR